MEEIERCIEIQTMNVFTIVIPLVTLIHKVIVDVIPPMIVMRDAVIHVIQ